MSLADFRDLVVIVYGILGILLFLVLIVVAVGIFFTIRGATKAIRTRFEAQVDPALEELRATASNVRGASEFWADHAVSPLIKTVATVRGARRGLRSAASLVGRGRRR
jgi:hypothetical protein